MIPFPAPLLPLVSPVAETGLHAVFTACARRFALPIAQVQEVVRELEITPVPHTGDSWLGVSNLRGEVLPVLTLAPWFGRSPQEPAVRVSAGVSSERPIFLVLRSDAGKVALAADGSARVVALPADQCGPVAESAFDPAALGLLTACWQGEETPAWCLDLNRLVDRVRFPDPGLLSED